MNRLLQNIKATGAFLVLLAFTSCTLSAQEHWVGTWGTAGQLAESHNNPPPPGLGNNSFRQIVQVSIGGETARLQLTNEFSNATTEILAVELAHAKTAGSSSEIDESTTVSLTFNGKPGVTMAAGTTAVSDPVKFPMGPRQNVAITIHYGNASSTSVSGHPGSRTTSYIAKGNTNDFSNATRTDHWYTIKGIDVMADAEAGAVAILGNSITDGRGSTTNQQNRWADVLSRRLLANEATKNSTKRSAASWLSSSVTRTPCRCRFSRRSCSTWASVATACWPVALAPQAAAAIVATCWNKLV